MKHTEFKLQKAVCQYINHQHPNVLFLSDTIASCKLTAMQAMRNKSIQKKGFKTPDLIIFKPNNKFKGLFIELKIESPFKKDGQIKKDEHLEAQQATIDKLNELGYFACFSWTFEDAKKIIDKYITNIL